MNSNYNKNWDKYNKTYFSEVLDSVNFDQPVSLRSFNYIYTKAGNMMDLSVTDKVVDFGCGNGNLAFYLFLKYGCFVTGLDYSKDAIDLASENKKNFFHQLKRRDNQIISFRQSFIDRLPNLSGIRAVFLVDVIEHLNNQEIDKILRTFPKWNLNKGIILVLHTDNNLFLKYIRPVIDALLVILKRQTPREIKKRNQWEKERHVNLTNVKKLSSKLAGYGYQVNKVDYPEVDKKRLIAQLGFLTKNEKVLKFIGFCLRYLDILKPSFYMVAEYYGKTD